MIEYLENPKDSPEKLQKQIKQLSKAAGHKKNLQQLINFLYTRNKHLDIEVEKMINNPIKITATL